MVRYKHFEGPCYIEVQDKRATQALPLVLLYLAISVDLCCLGNKPRLAP
jgi:hypothetical protein